MNLRALNLLLILVLLGACSAPAKPVAPPTYDETVAVTITSLRDYWAVKLQTLPGGYTPIPIYSYDSPDDLECGGEPADMNNAYFCSKSHIGQYMGFDTNYLRKRYDIYGPGWIYVLFSHEFAHSIQDRVHQEFPDTRSSELQADCLAGAYVAEMGRTGILPIDNLAVDGARSVYYNALGDDAKGKKREGLPSLPEGHGTGAERYTNFYAGYTGGIPACGLKDVG